MTSSHEVLCAEVCRLVIYSLQNSHIPKTQVVKKNSVYTVELYFPYKILPNIPFSFYNQSLVSMADTFPAILGYIICL